MGLSAPDTTRMRGSRVPTRLSGCSIQDHRQQTGDAARSRGNCRGAAVLRRRTPRHVGCFRRTRPARRSGRLRMSRFGRHNVRVGTWEDQSLVPVVLPSDQERRVAVGALDVQDKTAPAGPFHRRTLHDEPVTLCRMHCRLPSMCRASGGPSSPSIMARRARRGQRHPNTAATIRSLHGDPDAVARWPAGDDAKPVTPSRRPSAGPMRRRPRGAR